MLALIDDLEPYWLVPIRLRAQAELVPDQPWISRHELPKMGVVVPRASWFVCADLVGEPLDVDPRIVSPIALRSIIRCRGRPVSPHEVSQLARAREPLVLIPAGTVLKVDDVFAWGDSKVPGVLGHAIDFASTEGRVIRVTTEARRQADDAAGIWRQGLTWREFACAAVVVPASHPMTDPTACAAMVSRIQRQARRDFISAASQ